MGNILQRHTTTLYDQYFFGNHEFCLKKKNPFIFIQKGQFIDMSGSVYIHL